MALPVNNNMNFISPEATNVFRSIRKSLGNDTDEKTNRIAGFAILGLSKLAVGAFITFFGTLLAVSGIPFVAVPGYFLIAGGVSLCVMGRDLFIIAKNEQKGKVVEDDADGLKGQVKSIWNRAKSSAAELSAGAGEALFGTGDPTEAMKARNIKTLTEGTLLRPIWNAVLPLIL